jgi:beta-lactamase class A
MVVINNDNDRIEKMGLKNTYLYKKVYKPAEGPMPADQKKYGLGKTTPREIAAAIASIELCELGSPDLCKKMVEIMRNQQYRNMIPHYIEAETDTSEKPSAIIDKLGMLDAVRADVGIVYSNAGPIVISAFTYENKDQRWIFENSGELLIAHMAKDIVDAWAPAGVKTGEELAH